MKWLTLLLIASCLTLGCAAHPRAARPAPPLPKPTTNATPASGWFDVRAFGAAGDGSTIDTPAINSAIDAASSAAGGTVHFPAGRYLCGSIHLKSNITLYLDSGAVIEAASPSVAPFDAPEDTGQRHYQDFGHSHWHNSLIWGEDLENVAIVGHGLIYGKGLERGIRGDPVPGVGNKAISLKNCHNVTLRDVSILHGGHFAILATGVDNLTIDNVKIDTNRDGIDIDCCRNVRVTNTSVNSPWDDAIVLKTSYGLGKLKDTSDVTISDCYVTGGLIEGTLLDGTFQTSAKDYASRTGRIKFGTESNGSYKNITISNCVLEDCGGILIESVDGGAIEDVTISNIAMRQIVTTPIFIRLGARLRGPNSPQVGTIKRIDISNVVASSVNAGLGSIISGIPDHPIEDVKISNMIVQSEGGKTAKDAERVPAEKEKDYPEPGMFGAMPSYGFFLRHVRGIEMSDVKLQTIEPDQRPAFHLVDVEDADFQHVKWPRVENGSSFMLKDVKNFELHDSLNLPDTKIDKVDEKRF